MAIFTDVWCPCGLMELFEEAGVPSNHPLHAKMKSAATSFLGEEMGIDSVDQLIAHSVVACEKFVKCLDVPKAKQKVIRDALNQKKKESGISNNPSGFGRRINYDADICVVQINPKRIGSKPYARYELYKAATTRREFIDFGGLPRDFNYDLNHGYVSIHNERSCSMEDIWRDQPTAADAKELIECCNESLERNLMAAEDFSIVSGDEASFGERSRPTTPSMPPPGHDRPRPTTPSHAPPDDATLQWS